VPLLLDRVFSRVGYMLGLVERGMSGQRERLRNGPSGDTHAHDSVRLSRTRWVSLNILETMCSLYLSVRKFKCFEVEVSGRKLGIISDITRGLTTQSPSKISFS
jgi:hypothetical protein